MVTDCNPGKIGFQPHGRREVVAKFDGGRMSLDGGALLLRSADMLFDVTSRLAACFTDHRKPERIEHALPVLVAQPVMGIALGYEDITNLERSDIGARALYEDLYCGRGDMENRIKEQQLELFADRTSTHGIPSNQLRVYFSVFAGILLGIIRRVGLKDTGMERAQCDTIRVRLLKVACRLEISVRRVSLSLSSVFPLQMLFAHAAAALHHAVAARAP